MLGITRVMVIALILLACSAVGETVSLRGKSFADPVDAQFSTPEGLDGWVVLCLADYEGDLMAGGSFWGNRVKARNVARWDGSEWGSLGSGMNDLVWSLTVYSGDPVAGGWFTEAGSMAANHIARWDGSEWDSLGSGINGQVYSLTVYGGDLIAGGWFTAAGSVPASRIARWDGTEWDSLGPGMNGAVRSLMVYNGDLIGGGSFTEAGGVAANHIARWDGSTWQPLGSGMNGSVWSLTVYDGDLIAGGDFTTTGGVDANHIARWDGFEWYALGSGTDSTVHALAVYDNNLIAGGVAAHRVAQWDGSEWDSLGSGMDSAVYALTVYDDELIAGGFFVEAGGVAAKHIAQWDGSIWQPVPSAPDIMVYRSYDTIYPGQTLAYYIHPAAQEGYADPVTLSISGQPPDWGYFFSRPIIQGLESSSLNFLPGYAPATGTYNMQIIGTAGPEADTIDISATIEELPVCFDDYSLTEGTVGMNVTNSGTFGKGFGQLGSIDPVTGDEKPSLEYPSDSDVEYLFGGALWIGGIIGFDTLVSTGADGWSTPGAELNPDVCPDGAIELGALPNNEMTTRYTDTVEGHWIGLDPMLNRPHIPLGLAVTQEVRRWNELGDADGDVFVFDCEIRNIGGSIINDGWIGVYVDADVGHVDNEERYFDDLSGYLASDEIAYVIDNDGDPSDGAWTARSARGAMGVKLLGSNESLNMTQFNWWMSNGNPALDWGPRRDVEPLRDFSTGGLGTPEGDRNKYYVLSHAERDYDQLFAALDHTGDGWLPPHTDAIYIENIADGFDARFLYSFGPFDLGGNEVLRFAFAVAVADGVHVNPDDFDTHFDAMNPQAFYDLLDFTNLIAKMDAAQAKYDEGHYCCTGVVGDVNMSGDADPTIGDVSLLIDALFISTDLSMLECLTEADVNQSGGADPQESDITIGDVSMLIDLLFISVDLSLLPECP